VGDPRSNCNRPDTPPGAPRPTGQNGRQVLRQICNLQKSRMPNQNGETLMPVVCKEFVIAADVTSALS
jgi:hypothetical protein